VTGWIYFAGAMVVTLLGVVDLLSHLESSKPVNSLGRGYFAPTDQLFRTL
jgi:hypothetical protein